MNLHYRLPVMFLKEGRHYVAHSPALDLNVQATSVASAKQRFIEAAELFFEELERKGTTNEVLEELGWQKVRRHQWQPPQIIDRAPSEIEVPVPA